MSVAALSSEDTWALFVLNRHIQQGEHFVDIDEVNQMIETTSNMCAVRVHGHKVTSDDPFSC